ncbi:MAG: PfkB family carbohydrate kinase [Christensenellales bacterium]|jgi:2-dehydro-3-deoxygluconokinase
MSKTVCFGEIMLRLSPPGSERIVQARSFEVVYGGSEANVAVSLAVMGQRAAFVTRLPEGPVGQACYNELRRQGVDVGDILRGGERLGIYYLEKGASLRPMEVIYDRKGSAIAQARPDMFDWERIFADADWFHFSGITPALGPGPAEACAEAVRAAKRLGLTVSCDLNYRKNLWTGEQAGAVLRPMMAGVDLLFANPWALGEVFGVRTEPDDPERQSIRAAQRAAELLGVRQMAVTLKEEPSALVNRYGGLYWREGQVYRAKRREVPLVDRVGAGDAFAAGFIYAQKEGCTPQQTVDFAAAAACLKHSIPGDANQVTAQQVWALARA